MHDALMYHLMFSSSLTVTYTEAVYSTEYTARGDRLVRKKTSAKPSRVPHFTVARRCQEEW